MIGRTAVRKQLFPHGASISPPNTNTGHAQYAGSDGQYDSPLPCASLACLEERRALHAQLAVKTQELHDEKEQHNRLYMQKNEECARFAQALVRTPKVVYCVFYISCVYVNNLMRLLLC